MQNHVSFIASKHASEQRRQLVRLMEMARKTAGFDPDRSVRAREVKSKAADGSEITVTVLFVRTGKESILESIENWFFSRQDQKLGRQLVERAFPEWQGTEKKTFLTSLFEKDRITIRTLDDKVEPRKKASAAFRISWQQAAEAFRTVLDRHPGKGYLPSQWGFAGSQIVYMRSCVGLSPRCSKADDMFEKFIAFAEGLQSDDFRLVPVDTRQHLVEQARQFCTAWAGQKALKPERHKHTVCTGKLGFLDELVVQFQKSFAA